MNIEVYWLQYRDLRIFLTVDLNDPGRRGLSPVFKVYLCIATQHDWRLVILAAIVCVVGSVCAFHLYSKAPLFKNWRRAAPHGSA